MGTKERIRYVFPTPDMDIPTGRGYVKVLRTFVFQPDAAILLVDNTCDSISRISEVDSYGVCYAIPRSDNTFRLFHTKSFNTYAKATVEFMQWVGRNV